MGDPLARRAAVCRKSFGFSSLSIRKGLVLTFWEGRQPLSWVVSLLFSASYPQDRRSYYLFFNYMFFNYMYMFPLCTYLLACGVSALHVENCPESHKPVEISDLRAQSDSRSGEAGRVQDGPPRPSGASLAAGKGRCAAYRGRHSVPTRMIFRLFGSFVLDTELLGSLRSCPMFGRDFVNPFHPRAVEKCGCGREGDCCVGLRA